MVKIQGAKEFATLTVNPTTPVEGEVWYNSTDKALKLYNGTSIVSVGGNITFSIQDSRAFIEKMKVDGDWAYTGYQLDSFTVAAGSQATVDTGIVTADYDATNDKYVCHWYNFLDETPTAFTGYALSSFTRTVYDMENDRWVIFRSTGNSTAPPWQVFYSIWNADMTTELKAEVEITGPFTISNYTTNPVWTACARGDYIGIIMKETFGSTGRARGMFLIWNSNTDTLVQSQTTFSNVGSSTSAGQLGTAYGVFDIRYYLHLVHTAGSFRERAVWNTIGAAYIFGPATTNLLDEGCVNYYNEGSDRVLMVQSTSNWHYNASTGSYTGAIEAGGVAMIDDNEYIWLQSGNIRTIGNALIGTSALGTGGYINNYFQQGSRVWGSDGVSYAAIDVGDYTTILTVSPVGHGLTSGADMSRYYSVPVTATTLWALNADLYKNTQPLGYEDSVVPAINAFIPGTAFFGLFFDLYGVATPTNTTVDWDLSVDNGSTYAYTGLASGFYQDIAGVTVTGGIKPLVNLKSTDPDVTPEFNGWGMKAWFNE